MLFFSSLLTSLTYIFVGNDKFVFAASFLEKRLFDCSVGLYVHYMIIFSLCQDILNNFFKKTRGRFYDFFVKNILIEVFMIDQSFLPTLYEFLLIISCKSVIMNEKVVKAERLQSRMPSRLGRDAGGEYGGACL